MVSLLMVDVNTGLVEERVAHDDLEKNWGVFPEFAQYSQLYRGER